VAFEEFSPKVSKKKKTMLSWTVQIILKKDNFYPARKANTNNGNKNN
jgi:hypothetical protein